MNLKEALKLSKYKIGVLILWVILLVVLESNCKTLGGLTPTRLECILNSLQNPLWYIVLIVGGAVIYSIYSILAWAISRFKK